MSKVRVLGYAIVSTYGKVRELWQTKPSMAVAQYDEYENTMGGAPHSCVELVSKADYDVLLARIEEATAAEKEKDQ